MNAVCISLSQISCKRKLHFGVDHLLVSERNINSPLLLGKTPRGTWICRVRNPTAFGEEGIALIFHTFTFRLVDSMVATISPVYEAQTQMTEEFEKKISIWSSIDRETFKGNNRALWRKWQDGGRSHGHRRFHVRRKRGGHWKWIMDNPINILFNQKLWKCSFSCCSI